MTRIGTAARLGYVIVQPVVSPVALSSYSTTEVSPVSPLLVTRYFPATVLRSRGAAGGAAGAIAGAGAGAIAAVVSVAGVEVSDFTHATNTAVIEISARLRIVLP